MVPNFGSYAPRKHGRKHSHSQPHQSSPNASISHSLSHPDVTATSAATAAAAVAVAAAEFTTSGNAPHGWDAANSAAWGATGGGVHGIDPPSSAPPSIADMDIDEAAWRVSDNMALKSVSLAGFEDDNPVASGAGLPPLSPSHDTPPYDDNTFSVDTPLQLTLISHSHNPPSPPTLSTHPLHPPPPLHSPSPPPSTISTHPPFPRPGTGAKKSRGTRGSFAGSFLRDPSRGSFAGTFAGPFAREPSRASFARGGDNNNHNHRGSFAMDPRGGHGSHLPSFMHQSSSLLHHGNGPTTPPFLSPIHSPMHSPPGSASNNLRKSSALSLNGQGVGDIVQMFDKDPFTSVGRYPHSLSFSYIPIDMHINNYTYHYQQLQAHSLVTNTTS